MVETRKKAQMKAAFQASDVTLDQLVGYHMKRAFNVVQADLTRTLKPFDLRMLTYSALALITDNPGLRQSQLAGAMDVERPNLVVILDQLEQRDLILRKPVPSDRRAQALHVTLKGQRLFARALAAVTAHEHALLQDIDPDTQATVIAALRQIQAKGTP